MQHTPTHPEGASPLVSVIVPVYNDAERLKLCLEALAAQDYPCYEVIVADNGSTDREVERVCEAFGVTFVTETKVGSYAARNTGVSLAKGELLAFTDADCIPEPQWLARGVKRFVKTPNCGLVGGRIRVFAQDPERPTTVELYEVALAFPQRTYVENSRYGATANVFTSRAVFEEVGPFNERLRSGGDREWGQRVAAAGYTLVYAHEACVRHPARRTFAELYKKSHRTVGGLRDTDARWSTAAMLLKEYLKPPVKLSLQVLRDEQHGFSLQQKVRVCGVALASRLMNAAETVKLWAGRTPSSRA